MAATTAATRKATDEWLLKEEAAKLLGVATRQVERRARHGYIESKRLARGINETTARVVFSRADILALKAGKPNMHAVPVPADAPEASPKPEATTKGGEVTAIAKRPDPAGDPFAGLPAFLARLSALYPAQPATMPGPFVSLAEAVTQSGMPASWLLAQARAGVPWAVNVGTGKKAFWRFAIAAGTGK